MKSLEPISNLCNNVVDEVIYHKSSNTGCLTGFKDIDKIVDGLHESQLVFVAARPAMGKVFFTINIACHIAQQFESENQKQNGKEKIVAYFSLELKNKDVVQAILSHKCNIPLYNLRHNQIQNYRKDLLNGNMTLQNFPLYINDLVLDLEDLRENLISLQEKNKTIGLIVIDNLQALENGFRAKGKKISLFGITCALKNLAKEFNVPVLVNLGLDKKIEERKNPRPRLSDLPSKEREMADVIMFLHRESYYLSNKFVTKHRNESAKAFALREAKLQQKKTAAENKVEVTIAKNHGPTGKVILSWDPMYVCFKDLKD